MSIERRTFAVAKHSAPIEWRAAPDGKGPGTITALGIVFNRYSENLGGWVEQIAPSAPKRNMGDNVVGLLNHDPNFPLGRTGRNMTIALEDAGVRYTIDLPATRTAEDVAMNVREGIIDGSSFAFSIAPQGVEWGETDQGFPLRTVTAFARLYDMSPVIYPAYPATSEGDAAPALRSLAEWSGQDIREIRSLAESGHLIDVIRAKRAEPPSEPPAAPLDLSELIAAKRRLLDRAAAYRAL